MAEVWIVTSIPPKLDRRDGGRAIGAQYQQMCLRAWQEIGFRILSVNSETEIEELGAAYPDVTFVPSARDAQALTGRGNPFVADLLLAAKSTPGQVAGIVNSDILFEPNAWWRQGLPAIASSKIAVFRRYDSNRLHGGALRLLRWGFDCFFFPKDAVHRVLDLSLAFALGSPWWDFWLPTAFAFSGYELHVFNAPVCLHLMHRQAYSMHLWRFLGSQFAEWAVGASAQRAVDRHWDPLLSMCRRIQASKNVESGGADALLHELSNICMSLACTAGSGALAKSPPASTPEPAPAGARPFAHVRERIEAGQLFERAEASQTDAEREDLLRQGLKLAPADTHGLSDLVKLLRREGRDQEASDVLDGTGTCIADDDGLRAMYAELLLSAEKYDRAERFLGSEVDRAMQTPGDRYRYAMALKGNGNLVAARRALREVLARDPEHAAAYEELKTLGGDGSLRSRTTDLIRQLFG